MGIWLKSNEEVLESLGIPEAGYAYDGHGGPCEIRLFELSGDGDMEVLKKVASAIALLSPEECDVDLPEGATIFSGEVAILAKSEADTDISTYAGIEYGVNPDHWCLLLDRTGCLYFMDDEAEGRNDIPELAKSAFAAEDMMVVPDFKKFEWLSEGGRIIKLRLEEAGWTVNLRVTNGESGAVPNFGY